MWISEGSFIGFPVENIRVVIMDGASRAVDLSKLAMSYNIREDLISTASSTLTPFEDSDFLLFEEADSFLAIEDDPTSPEVDPTYYDPDGGILLLETILNSAPSPPLQGNYFPET
ncbi:hypothetical protein Tco_0694279 [Tanacetum coccineum]